MPPRSCDVAVEQYEIRELTFANYGDCVKKGKTTKRLQAALIAASSPWNLLEVIIVGD